MGVSIDSNTVSINGSSIPASLALDADDDKIIIVSLSNSTTVAVGSVIVLTLNGLTNPYNVMPSNLFTIVLLDGANDIEVNKKTDLALQITTIGTFEHEANFGTTPNLVDSPLNMFILF